MGPITLHANLKKLTRKEDVSRTAPWALSTAWESLLQRVHDTEERKCLGEERAVCEVGHEASS